VAVHFATPVCGLSLSISQASRNLENPSFVTASELDSCRAAGERRPERQRDEGAGRNQHGFYLPLFPGQEMRDGELPPLGD
jgi:hypothetical protein